MFWWGRAWWEILSRRFRAEWIFGRRASGPAIKLEFGEGDSDADITLHACLPWVFSIWLTIGDVWRTKSFWTGFYIYEKVSYCVSLAAFSNEHSRTDPWWRKMLYRDFPWALAWRSTEVLTDGLREAIWREDRKSRRVGDTFESMREQDKAAKSVSSTLPYRYVLKDGTVQDVLATIHLERREWRARWYPVIPIKKSCTTIAVNFSAEVGEGTGSWKGGVLGCGYDLNGSETAVECLRRMERERKFYR